MAPRALGRTVAVAGRRAAPADPRRCGERLAGAPEHFAARGGQYLVAPDEWQTARPAGDEAVAGRLHRAPASTSPTSPCWRSGERREPHDPWPSGPWARMRYPAARRSGVRPAARGAPAAVRPVHRRGDARELESEVAERLEQLSALLAAHQVPERDRNDGCRPDLPGRGHPLIPPYIVDCDARSTSADASRSPASISAAAPRFTAACRPCCSTTSWAGSSTTTGRGRPHRLPPRRLPARDPAGRRAVQRRAGPNRRPQAVRDRPLTDAGATLSSRSTACSSSCVRASRERVEVVP